MRARRWLMAALVASLFLGVFDTAPVDAGPLARIKKAAKALGRKTASFVARARTAIRRRAKGLRARVRRATQAVLDRLMGPKSRLERVFKVVTPATADRYLKPGDIYVKFPSKKLALIQRVIRAGQRVIQVLGSIFSGAMRLGSPRGFHSGMYVGKGLVSEADGEGISDAAVTTHSLDYQANYVLLVYRPKDESLAKRAEKVARRWADGTMRYLIPLRVFRSGSFGRRARAEALAFVRDANRRGGPRGYEKMYCSQFVLAAYQAAALLPQLRRNRLLRAESLRMPVALRRHASNTSPLGLQAHLEKGVRTGHWKVVGAFLVKKGSTPR